MLQVSIKSADHWARVRQHLSYAGIVLPTDAIGAARQSLAAEHPRQTGAVSDMSKSSEFGRYFEAASGIRMISEATPVEIYHSIEREIRS
jgi:hypothetical protein